MDEVSHVLVKEESLLVDVLVRLACERLTQKQKQILEFLSKNENLTATSLVKKLSIELHCSRSSLWNNLNSLKKAGLVESEVSVPLSLTATGKKLVEVKDG